MQTLKAWENICKFVSDSYRVGSVADYIADPNNIKIIFKHDVECDPMRALHMAEIENRLGVKATYYFQADVAFNNQDILKKIADLNHEIAYHYDVMDAQSGNIGLAIKEFEENMIKFRSLGYVVKTVCPHGNPLMQRVGWTSNKDFFRNDLVKNNYLGVFDVVVQSKDMFENGFSYITDAGYSWKLVASINENDRIQSEDKELSDLKKYVIDSNRFPIIISSHPHRWLSNCLQAFLKKVIFKAARKLSRILSKVPVLHKFMSKFYFVARKF